MFKNAKVGNRVWDLGLGWGTVQFIGKDSKYPLSVLFDIRYHSQEISDTYTLDGRKNTNHPNSTLFWNEFKIPPEAFIKPLSKLY
jgi:hypothetical protein